MIIQIGNVDLKVSLVDNEATRSLIERLKNGPITIAMNDYAKMEKVGDLGFSLPTDDKYTTTKSGDLILYLGHMFVIYYRPNTWNFTRLGTIENISDNQLQDLLGKGDVVVTLLLEK